MFHIQLPHPELNCTMMGLRYLADIVHVYVRVEIVVCVVPRDEVHYPPAGCSTTIGRRYIHCRNTSNVTKQNLFRSKDTQTTNVYPRAASHQVIRRQHVFSWIRWRPPPPNEKKRIHLTSQHCQMPKQWKGKRPSGGILRRSNEPVIGHTRFNGLIKDEAVKKTRIGGKSLHWAGTRRSGKGMCHA